MSCDGLSAFTTPSYIKRCNQASAAALCSNKRERDTVMY